jgi:predicted acylesterase/phospholipase RssA
VYDKRFLPGSETGVGPQGVKGQPGIVMGQKIKLFFNTLVRDYLGEREIEALPLPLSIIATDIVGRRESGLPSGQPVAGDARQHVGSRPDGAGRGRWQETGRWRPGR